MKKTLTAAILAVLLLAGCGAGENTPGAASSAPADFPVVGEPSRFSGDPLETVTAALECSQYPGDTQDLTISVTNTGQAEASVGAADLELLQDEVWYSLNLAPRDGGYWGPPADLYYISPGQTRSFSLALAAYGSPLKAGRYRVVFSTPEGSYAAVEFDIT